eukprot:365053-Chlamydomonas_euryale.AAC.25
MHLCTPSSHAAFFKRLHALLVGATLAKSNNCDAGETIQRLVSRACPGACMMQHTLVPHLVATNGDRKHEHGEHHQQQMLLLSHSVICNWLSCRPAGVSRHPLQGMAGIAVGQGEAPQVVEEHQNSPTLTNRLVYLMRFMARPVGFFFFSCGGTLGVWPRTLPARAREPWTLPASREKEFHL